MAGPGGGPPCKSHTKSRKGCKTCKNRHIRCDELSPQCQNCTKHNCRCDYMDSPPPGENVANSPKEPDLLLNPGVKAEIDTWIRTGVYPFPEIRLCTRHQFGGLGRVDLRLVHHLSTIYRDLHGKGLLQCAPWVEKLPIFLDTAIDHDFVMSAILAFSATHLAWLTKSVETERLAYQHRGVALNGLQGAIGEFSEENSDPILAAQMLLSWQESDWGAWTSIIHGTSTVISSMEAWKSGSKLASYVEHHVISRQSTYFNPLSSLRTPMVPEDDDSLQDAVSSLHHLCTYLQNSPNTYRRMSKVLELAQEVELYYSSTPVSGLFDKMQSLRSHLLWIPIALVQGPETSNLGLVAIAHLYALGLAIDASIPELKGAAFGALTASSIDEIDRKIRYSSAISHHQSFEATTLNDLMEFPRLIASKHRWHDPSFSPASEPCVSGQQSPYGFQNLHLGSAPHTPNFSPSLPVFANLSSEDLNMPPSPFLQSYHPPAIRRPSQLAENPSRRGSTAFEQRSFSSLGPRGSSPAYSPSYSPAQGYFEDQQRVSFGEPRPGYANGCVTPSVWT